MNKVKKGSITSHKKEMKRAEERKIRRRLGYLSKDYLAHKERLANKQKRKNENNK